VQTDIAAQGVVPRLDPETESAVYRIAQEALTNAARHSGATHVVVSLHFDGDRLTAMVRDDGSGFLISDGRAPDRVGGDGVAESTSGFGLNGMRERAELVGAELEVESHPGAGTTVRVSVSMSEPAESGS
jgi:signal transduction histidine kinase